MKKLCFIFISLFCFVFSGCVSTKDNRFEFTYTGISTISYDQAAQNALNRLARENPSLLNEDFSKFDVMYYEPVFISITDAYNCWVFGDPESSEAKSAKNYYTSDTFLTSVGNAGKSINNQQRKNSLWAEYVNSHYFYACRIGYFKKELQAPAEQ